MKRVSAWMVGQNWEICRGFRASTWISNGLDQCSHPQHLTQRPTYIYSFIANSFNLSTWSIHWVFEIRLAQIQQFMYSCITAPQAWGLRVFIFEIDRTWFEWNKFWTVCKRPGVSRCFFKILLFPRMPWKVYFSMLFGWWDWFSKYMISIKV